MYYESGVSETTYGWFTKCGRRVMVYLGIPVVYDDAGDNWWPNLLHVCPNLASNEPIGADPLELIPHLLSHLIKIGDLAREISHAMDCNGHKPDKAAELIQQLVSNRRWSIGNK